MMDIIKKIFKTFFKVAFAFFMAICIIFIVFIYFFPLLCACRPTEDLNQIRAYILKAKRTNFKEGIDDLRCNYLQRVNSTFMNNLEFLGLKEKTNLKDILEELINHDDIVYKKRGLEFLGVLVDVNDTYSKNVAKNLIKKGAIDKNFSILNPKFAIENAN